MPVPAALTLYTRSLRTSNISVHIKRAMAKLSDPESVQDVLIAQVAVSARHGRCRVDGSADAFQFLHCRDWARGCL